MASDVTPGTLIGFGVPYEFTEESIWTAQLTASQQGPYPGAAEPAAGDDPRLRLITTGSQTASGKLRVRTHKAGNPGPDGAAFVWRNEASPAEDYRGRDFQQLVGWESIVYTASASLRADDPDVCTLSDGTVVAVFQKLTGGSYLVRVARKGPDDASWSVVTAYTGGSTVGDGYHPGICIARGADGEEELLIAHWVYDAVASEAQIQTLRSTDSGASWSVVSSAALETPLDVSGTVGSGSQGNEASRIRIAYKGEQFLLLYHAIRNNTSAARDELIQCACTDTIGGRFVQIDALLTAHHHSIVVLDEHFLICALFQSVANTYYLDSATNEFSAFLDESRRPVSELDFSYVSSSGSNYFIAEGSAWVDDDGTLFWALWNQDSAAPNEATVLIFSPDEGKSWFRCGEGSQSTGAGAQVLDFGDDDVVARHFVGTSSAGRQILLHQWSADVSTEGTYSIGAAYLGGYSTVTLPGLRTFAPRDKRAPWSHTYLPVEKPDDISSGPWTLTGTDTASLASGALNISTSSQITCYDATPSSTQAQGLIVFASLTAVSGGSTSTLARAIRLTLSDSTDDYQVALRISTGAMRLIDAHSGANLGEVSDIAPSGGIEILLALNAGQVAMFYRAASTKSDRVWTAGPASTSLTNDTASPTGNNEIEWGHCASATAETNWIALCFAAGQQTAPSLTGGYSNPADLYGRDYAAQGYAVYVDSGVRITAESGGGREGEIYEIDARYRYPLSRALLSQNLSQSVGWRSVNNGGGALSAMRIPLLLNSAEASPGSQVGTFGSDLIFLFLSGINFANFTVEYYASGAWNTLATIDTAITAGTWSATRRNQVIELPTSGTNSSTPYLFQDECAGWTAKLGSEYWRLSGNTPGVFGAFSTGAQVRPTFFVDSSTGGTASGQLELWPSSVVVVLNTGAAQGSAWALNISGSATADNEFRIDGSLALGRVFVPGRRYDWGRVRTYQPNSLAARSPQGVFRGRKRSEGGRIVRFAWPGMISTSALFGNATDPDYWRASTAGGNDPVIALDDVLSLEGMFRQLGNHAPFVYLPRIQPNAVSRVLNRRHEQALMVATTPVEYETVLGDEGSSEALRVASILAEEMQ